MFSFQPKKPEKKHSKCSKCRTPIYKLDDGDCIRHIIVDNGSTRFQCLWCRNVLEFNVKAVDKHELQCIYRPLKCHCELNIHTAILLNKKELLEHNRIVQENLQEAVLDYEGRVKIATRELWNRKNKNTDPLDWLNNARQQLVRMLYFIRNPGPARLVKSNPTKPKPSTECKGTQTSVFPPHPGPPRYCGLRPAGFSDSESEDDLGVFANRTSTPTDDKKSTPPKSRHRLFTEEAEKYFKRQQKKEAEQTSAKIKKDPDNTDIAIQEGSAKTITLAEFAAMQ
jgi:hypothetical protein